MPQLFYRRHYETIEQVLGAAYFHTRSTLGRRTLDRLVKLFARAFAADAPDTFNADLFARGVERSSHSDMEG